MRLKLAFAGTAEIVIPILDALFENRNHIICQIYTQPDRRVGRGRILRQGAVKSWGNAHNIPVYQPESTTELATAQLDDIDLLIVIAYGLILPEHLINRPRLGAINIHLSILPRWRGAAPVQRAIEAGDLETGISIMQMDKGLDTGPILMQLPCKINPDDTTQSLYAKLVKMSADHIDACIDQIAAQKIQASAQDEKDATYATKISAEEAILDWREPAYVLERKVRAFNPWPVMKVRSAHTQFKIWEASVQTNDTGMQPGMLFIDKKDIMITTSDDTLAVHRLQLPGGKIMTAQQMANGYRGPRSQYL